MLLKSEMGLKAALIDSLIAESGASIEVLISEMGFADTSRRADVVYLDEKGLHGIEIKSDRDSLLKLPAQLDAYDKVFNAVSILTTPKHLSSLRRQIKNRHGIILSDAKGLRWVRKPRYIVRLNKLAVLSALTKSEIRRLVSMRWKGSMSGLSKQDLLGVCASAVPLHTLTLYYYDCFKRRYTNRYELFKKERGSITLEEDVYLLTSEMGSVS